TASDSNFRFLPAKSQVWIWISQQGGNHPCRGPLASFRHRQRMCPLIRPLRTSRMGIRVAGEFNLAARHILICSSTRRRVPTRLNRPYYRNCKQELRLTEPRQFANTHLVLKCSHQTSVNSSSTATRRYKTCP